MTISTINDVAALAGVSVATVSNVINRKGTTAPKTEARVRAAIKQLNYIPNTLAKDLKTSRTSTIGIVVEDIGAFMTGQIIEGISAVCEAQDFALSLYNLRLEHLALLQKYVEYDKLVCLPEFRHSVELSVTSLLASRVSGLIYVGLHPRDVEGILPELPFPVVYAYCFTKSGDDYTVNYDDYQGAKLAVDYLAGLGHQRIALISGPINSIPTHRRMQAYTESLMEHDLVFDPAYVCTGSWGFGMGYEQCGRLLDLPAPPTAIFCMNDPMAFGAMKAAHERGVRVPEDLSLHGFDNDSASGFVIPALTTIDLPLAQMGRASAKILLDLMAGRQADNPRILLPCAHIPRQSTARP